MKTYFIQISSILILALFFSACNYHNVEDYFDVAPIGNCDTTNITFSGDIFPLIVDNCLSCHNDITTYKDRNYDTYEGILEVAETGLLLNVIKHNPGYVKMPFERDKLKDCDILKVETWVIQGMKNN